MPRQKLVGNLRRGGWLDGNVGRVVDRALFFWEKRHVGQVTDRGEASRTQKRDVHRVMVRRRKMGKFFGMCWLDNSQEQ